VKRLLPALIAIAFSTVVGAVYAADQQEPGRSGDPSSAEKPAVKKPKVKSSGAHPAEPGRTGDPVSAEKPAKPSGEVKGAGAHPDEPGRSGDPVSAEKPKK
jgi:hypothetical protein